MSLRAAVVVLLLLCAARVAARELSFAEARAAAERMAPDVQLAQRRVDVSRSEVDMVAAQPNPTFAISSATHTAHLATSISLPVPLFGQRNATIRAARADATVAELDVTVRRREARWIVSLAYVDLWEAQARTRLLQSAATDMQRVAEVARERFEAGTGARLDVVRSIADRARSAADARGSAHLVAAASARLAPFIGVPSDMPLTAAGTPGYAVDGSVLERLERQLSQHPALERARAEVRASEAHIRDEQRQRWPIVTPQLGVNQFDPTTPGTDVIFGLSFELPLLNQRSGAIERARAQRSLAQTTADLDQRRLQADLMDAYLRTQGAQESLQALRSEVLPAMQEAKAMTDEGYQAGYVDLIRVLEAQRAWLDSRLEETGAAATWVRALADLEKASGANFQESQSHAP